VPALTVTPTTSIMLIATGTIVLANLAAALPARWAARTSAAALLRAE